MFSLIFQKKKKKKKSSNNNNMNKIYCAFNIFQNVFFFVLGALHRGSKFVNFCYDLMQNHLSYYTPYAHKVLF